MSRTTPWLILATVLSIASVASGAEFFVAPNGLDGNAGTRESPWPLAWANSELQPGDVAVLLDGTYAETPIAPARSGHKGNAITYRAANRHKALFQEGVGPAAVIVDGRSHITVDGIKVADVKRWVVGVKCDHITITNSHFADGHGLAEPDTIRLGAERVKIARIDYATNELWLDSNLSCKKGAPVSLEYAGTAPDLGAFEFR